MNTQKSLALILPLVLMSAPSFAIDSGLQSQPYTNSSQTVLSGEVVSVQAGANAPGTLTSGTISSEYAQVGQRGYITLNQGLNGIPAGSRVEFEVSNVRSAKRFKFDSPGELQLKAIQITYPDGRIARLNGNAYIVANPGETVLKGATTSERVKSTAVKTVGGAAAGAAIGVASAAIFGGRGAIGRGAWKGAAIGGGTGAAAALVSKGDEVVVNSGSRLFLRFPKSAQVQVSPN
jgi:hypothetical protein